MMFDNYVQQADLFIKEVAEQLGNAQDVQKAFRITRTVFHTLRDIITPEESLHLVSQLPMIMKAVYVDGWKTGKVNRIRSMNEFLQHLAGISDRPGVDFGNNERAIHTVQCVLDVLQRHVTTGEIHDIVEQFPHELRVLWKLPAGQPH